MERGFLIMKKKRYHSLGREIRNNTLDLKQHAKGVLFTTAPQTDPP